MSSEVCDNFATATAHEKFLNRTLISQLRRAFAQRIAFSDKLDVTGIISYSADGSQEKFLKINFSYDNQKSPDTEPAEDTNDQAALLGGECGFMEKEILFDQVGISASRSQPSNSPPLLAPLLLNTRCVSTPPSISNVSEFDYKSQSFSVSTNCEMKTEDRRDRRKSSKPKRQLLKNEIEKTEKNNLDEEYKNIKKRKISSTDINSLQISELGFDVNSSLILNAPPLINSQSACIPSVSVASSNLQQILSSLTAEQSTLASPSKSRHIMSPNYNSTFNGQKFQLQAPIFSNFPSTLKPESLTLTDILNKQNLENVYPNILNKPLVNNASVNTSLHLLQQDLLSAIYEAPGQPSKNVLLTKSVATAMSAAAMSSSNSSIRPAFNSTLVTANNNQGSPFSINAQSMSANAPVAITSSSGEILGTIPQNIASVLLNSASASNFFESASVSASCPNLNCSSSFPSSNVNVLRCSLPNTLQSNSFTNAMLSAGLTSPISISIPQMNSGTVSNPNQMTPMMMSQQPAFTVIGNFPSSLSSFANVPATLLSINNQNNRNPVSSTGTLTNSTIPASASNVTAIAAFLRSLAQLKQSSSDPSASALASSVSTIVTETNATETPVMSISTDSKITPNIGAPSLVSESSNVSSCANTGISQGSVDINSLAAAIAAVTGVFPRNPTITAGPIPGSIVLSCPKLPLAEQTATSCGNQPSINIATDPTGGLLSNLMQRPVVNTVDLPRSTVSNTNKDNAVNTQAPITQASLQKNFVTHSQKTENESPESTIDRILETIRGQIRAAEVSKTKLLPLNGSRKSCETIPIKRLPENCKDGSPQTVSRFHYPIKKLNGRLAIVAPNPASLSTTATSQHPPLSRSNNSGTISTDSGHKVYKCRYCGKIFNRKFCRERHERLHTGVKPYTCDVCDEKFIRLEDKKRHVRSILHTTRTAALAAAAQGKGVVIPVNRAEQETPEDEDEEEEDEDVSEFVNDSKLFIAEEGSLPAIYNEADDEDDGQDNSLDLSSVTTTSSKSPSPFKHSRRSALKQYVTPIRLPNNCLDSNETVSPT